jgi:hypothetical protein
MQKVLTVPDRWEVHSAEELVVTLGELRLRILQQPTSITAKKVGVGACLWDGAILLAAYLVSMPRHKFVGARCIELGAGVGLVGLALAKMGAEVSTAFQRPVEFPACLCMRHDCVFLLPCHATGRHVSTR